MELHLLPRSPSQQGKSLHNDPRCDSMTAPIVLQGHGHPNPPGQLSRPLACSKNAALSQFQRGVKIGLNPSHPGMTPLLHCHLYPHLLPVKGRVSHCPTGVVTTLQQNPKMQNGPFSRRSATLAQLYLKSTLGDQCHLSRAQLISQALVTGLLIGVNVISPNKLLGRWRLESKSWSCLTSATTN